jgi:hypothetical protein
METLFANRTRRYSLTSYEAPLHRASAAARIALLKIGLLGELSNRVINIGAYHEKCCAGKVGAGSV